MRRIASVTFLAWATLAFGVVQARAQTRPGGLSPSVARYDLDHDGKLNATERAAYRRDILQKMQPIREAMIKRYDFNQNGTLEPNERQALTQARQAQHANAEARALEKFDVNHNGTLDPAEQTVRTEAREAWLRQTRAQILQTFDVNRDGLLDESEKATIRQKAADARAKAMVAYDSNRDGRIDATERANATGVPDRRSPGTTPGGEGGKVTAVAGGEVVSEGGAARLSIPAGALAADARVALTGGKSGELREGGRRILGTYQISWNGPVLKKPGTLALSYESVASTVSASNLVIGQWTGDAWKDLGGTVAATDKRVSAPVAEPGRYALMERASAPAGASVVSNLRVSPSSGRGYAGGADIKFSLASPGGVSVRVYDTAGRHVRSVRSRESMSEGDHVVRWDGRASDGRTISNGLYLIVVEAPGNKLTRKLMFLR